ncbi:hypothetical protein OG871_39020 [Kitasatospora sp. NBC_00374]|uniref:hypothetical protein n=1 Tax=Kitasatospora sp. NBC_00374 TaxID=2975964 RepID=UPI0030E01393
MRTGECTAPVADRVSTLPDGQDGYEAAYQARLEDFAIRHRERLQHLFTRYGPQGEPGSPGRIEILDPP